MCVCVCLCSKYLARLNVLTECQRMGRGMGALHRARSSPQATGGEPDRCRSSTHCILLHPQEGVRRQCALVVRSLCRFCQSPSCQTTRRSRQGWHTESGAYGSLGQIRFPVATHQTTCQDHRYTKNITPSIPPQVSPTQLVQTRPSRLQSKFRCPGRPVWWSCRAVRHDKKHTDRLNG